MIVQLAGRHTKKIAVLFLMPFYLTSLFPVLVMASPYRPSIPYSSRYDNSGKTFTENPVAAVVSKQHKPSRTFKFVTAKHLFSGGPSQPEMTSFQSVGTNNMVNLFTGDFNYNIPLLDVGGYPVNIFYDGSVTMEQEASWVGLGWNINPGNINRNMRGIPDDFNGKDTLKQVQIMKPNKTWGLDIGADVELLGIKAPVNASLGMSFNNYLGPALDLSVRGSLAANISKSSGSEKIGAAKLTVGADINSRSGTSFFASASLTANAESKHNNASFGVGLSTGYNSRSGIKALTVSEQASLSTKEGIKGTHKKSGQDYYYSRGANNSKTLFSSSIDFAKPSYMPAIRMPVTNTAWSGHFQLGLGSWGVAADVEASVYGQRSEIVNADTLQKKPMVGYLYYQNAANNPNYVMDFTRFNDREVTPNTPVISVPQYSYDVFSIQGEGTGGSVRAYRNDLGYVRDNFTVSKDKNLSIGGDIDPPGHFGANVNVAKTPSTIGEWNSGNKLRAIIPFSASANKFENVYFRNPGETSVSDSNRFDQIGGTNLVRFVLGGSTSSPTIEPKLESFNSLNESGNTFINLSAKPVISDRNRRTQVVSFLTADEATVAGLDKTIKSYDNQTFLDNVTDTLLYQSIPRIDGVIRKAHHISQINVLENTGRRYVYGVPVYNLEQKDFTFSVDNAYSQLPDTVTVKDAQLSASSTLINDNSSRDGYVQVTTTPPYAHSFLLSGILSSDYVDVTGNGITEDDLGVATKFNYTRIRNGGDSVQRWRAPLSGDNSANFNPGTWSEVKDDKGIISFGSRESWYVNSIESKNMIALFYLSGRNDGKGTKGVYGDVDKVGSTVKKLDSIALYSKADLRTNGMAKARAIKTVHFTYKYLLCQNTPDNKFSTGDSTGKLTLQNIYFTYNGKTRAFKNNYSFSYNASDTLNNPLYKSFSADRWGNYKPKYLNPAGMKNSEYPYSIQDTAQKATIDKNASAWMLKKITLPSGGQMEINYESDDYAYVQDRRAADMMRIAGFGNTTTYSNASDRLYPGMSPGIENDYVFVQVPVACSNSTDVYNLYLKGMSQLAFRIWVLMPKGPEYITCYATFAQGAYGVDASNHNIIWIKMNEVGGKSSLSVTTLEYLRQSLPGQAFTGYDVSGEPGLQQVGDMLVGMWKSLKTAFTDPINAFRQDGKAMHTDLSKCFVRLNDPDGIKYGGGYRVKSVALKDNWNAMTGQYTASYGQNYDYTTTENFNGATRKISSGVASYEPSIGGEENPFQTIIQVADYLPLGPASYGAVEMPVLDAFFPSPVVGYSKVTVTSLKTDTSSLKKSRSGVGKQVTEFYTAKDYPVYYNYTPFDGNSDKSFHQGSTLAFFNKYSYDYKTQSQGFLIATNDMHGKTKAQSSYAENDTATRISYTQNFYKNTGANGPNDKFDFINKDNNGSVYPGNMGIDVELMTDTREFAVKSSSLEIQGQVDIFYTIVPIPIPTIWPVSSNAENIYRSVTTTKAVSYHSVLDSVVVIDKGSQVSTKNLAYDSYTGELLVSRTNNEFNQPVYNASYPAYWAYGGMGLAYKNIDAFYTGVNFRDGKIINAGFDFSGFESGDELLIKSPYGALSGCDAQITYGPDTLLWVYDKNKNNTSLITTPDFIFLNAKGKPTTMQGITFRVIRSGHRNMLDQKTAAVVSLDNPLATGKLFYNSSSKVVNSSASEYKERWLTDNDVFNRFRLLKDYVLCTTTEVPDSSGYLEQNINPYRKGIIGNFRPYRSMVFYDNRKEYDTTANTNISLNGQLDNFKLYWDFNGSGKLVPDANSTQWVWNTKMNKVNGKGLELETQDALGIYTAAQYGYNRTIPVAIANNSRYNEMFAESFEDFNYGESINTTLYNYFKNHVNFRGLSNSSVVKTDTTSFKAHSGKYALSVNPSSTALLSIPVIGQADTLTSPPALNYLNDTLKVLNNTGGNYSFIPTTPMSVSVYNEGTAYFGSGISLNILPSDTFVVSGGVTDRTHYYSQNADAYINVSTGATYYFGAEISTSYNNVGATVHTHSNGMGVTISDMLGNIVSNYALGQSGFNYTNGSYSVFLCPGIYHVVMSSTELYSATYNGSGGSSNNYNWSATSSLSYYKDLSKINGCVFTKPIAATTEMQNPVFNVPGYKKMLFSAWVRETCGNASNGIPCRDNSYTHNQVQLKYYNPSGTLIKDTSFNPAGPIIDGWQRYEGVFSVPAGTSNTILGLINSGASKIYFDDIRMHPFNANLKGYVYDPVTLRLLAELDANNFASYYEYDEEGTLIRTKVETREGIKTVTETRSALQKLIQ